MKASIARHAGKGLAVGVAAAALHLAASAHAFSTGSYDLFNHPDGVLTNVPDVQYGLRSDAFCTIGGTVSSCGPVDDRERTFTVENDGGQYVHNMSNVWLDWGKSDPYDPNKVDYTTARIHGTLVWNDVHDPDGTPEPAASTVWEVEYNLTNIKSLSGSNHPTMSDPGDADEYGWYVDMWNASGTMTRAYDGLEIDIYGKWMDGDPMYKTFVFAPDGHRCDTDTGGSANYGDFPGDSGYTSMCDPTSDTEMVGRGWFKLKYNGYWYKDGTNDWLVVAKPKDDDTPPDGEVPEPGTLALLGLGLVGLRYSRRRRKAA